MTTLLFLSLSLGWKYDWSKVTPVSASSCRCGVFISSLCQETSDQPRSSARITTTKTGYTAQLWNLRGQEVTFDSFNLCGNWGSEYHITQQDWERTKEHHNQGGKTQKLKTFFLNVTPLQSTVHWGRKSLRLIYSPILGGLVGTTATLAEEKRIMT